MAIKTSNLNNLVLDAERKLQLARENYELAAIERQALVQAIGGAIVYHRIASQFKPKPNLDTYSGEQKA